MTDVRVEVRIARPRTEVARYMFDPAHDREWTSGVIEARARQPGRLRSGSRVERQVSFLGRKFAYEYVVTAAGGNDFVQMEVDRPFPMKIRYELEDSSDGTLARIHATGDASGFYRVAGPLLGVMVRRNIRSDLETLKEMLESRNLR